MDILNDIGIKFNTDKSSNGHNYLRKYQKYLPFSRKDHIRILEIGVFEGASLKTWSEYFYNSEIVGADINPECKSIESDNIKIEIGSQNDQVFIESLFEKYGDFDLVIDDGSHLNSDIIFSFEKIFPRLKSGGIYVVEDACTSYWKEYGGGYLKENTAIEYFKNKIDESNFFGERLNSDPGWHFRDDDKLINQFSSNGINLIGFSIESIIFINSIIIVTKR